MAPHRHMCTDRGPRRGPRNSSRAWRILALLAAAAARLSFAAGDLDLRPIPDQSHLSGRLGAVGIVMIGDSERVRGMGTGFLVSSCHVLTANHVLAQAQGKVRVGMPVRFVPTLGNSAAMLADRAVWGKVAAAGRDFTPTGSASRFDVQNAAQDWALIELDRPLKTIGPFKMLYPGATLAPGTPIAAVGYTANAHMLTVNIHDRCSVGSFHGSGWPVALLIADCAVRSGMSGGPLLVDSGVELIAAGIVTERIEMDPKVAAVAVSVQSFADQITPVMRSSEVCAVGQPYAFPPDGSGHSLAPAGK